MHMLRYQWVHLLCVFLKKFNYFHLMHSKYLNRCINKIVLKIINLCMFCYEWIHLFSLFLRHLNYFHLMHSKYLNHCINYFKYFFFCWPRIILIKDCKKKSHIQHIIFLKRVHINQNIIKVLWIELATKYVCYQFEKLRIQYGYFHRLILIKVFVILFTLNIHIFCFKNNGILSLSLCYLSRNQYSSYLHGWSNP